MSMPHSLPVRGAPARSAQVGGLVHQADRRVAVRIELGDAQRRQVEVQALRGFNLIATANNRDKGVNDLSSALRRRFTTVVLPLPDSHAAAKQTIESFRRFAS